VRGGGAVVWMRGWWWWGIAFANARRERGFGLKSRNRAVVARFRVHRTKRQRGMVRRGGVVECMRWRQQWGCALVKREAGRGFWAKTRKRAVVARFRAHCVKRQWGMVRRGVVVVCRGGVVVHTRWWWWWWSCALVKREPERGVGPKTRNQAVVARFRVRCVKRRRGTVRGGGAMVCTR
jgi:hypothetical protein